MIVGAAVVEIHVHGSQSLKQKRGVVRSITQRLRNRFNLAVSEVGGQGTWQRAVLGIAASGSDPQRVRAVLERAISFVEELHLAEVRDADIEIIRLPYETGSGHDWEEGDLGNSDLDDLDLGKSDLGELDLGESDEEDS